MNKIFLIDDDVDDQLFFKDAIESINPSLECDIATNGRMALEKLKATAELPDIIFVDLNMPIMNGFDFLSQIKKSNTLSKIVIGIFSTSNFIKDQELTKEFGARFFLTKPADFQILREKLQQILSADFSSDNYISLI